MRRRIVFALTALVALMTFAAVALAQETDRVQVGVPGRNTTRGFSPALFVTVTTLPDFQRRSAGHWEGPICEFAPNPNLSAPISMTWDEGFSDSVRTAEAAARATLTFDWRTIESGAIAVPHMFRGRRLGTIPGFFVLTDADSQTGYHESAVGFPLGRGVFASIEFWSRGNALQCTVRGQPVAAWHREQARRALANVALDGNLPPARVTARRRAGRVSGSVTDGFGHPDGGIAVRLEKRLGKRWRVVRAGRTTGAGGYSLRPRGQGTYRVVATLAGVSARSAPVRFA